MVGAAGLNGCGGGSPNSVVPNVSSTTTNESARGMDATEQTSFAALAGASGASAIYGMDDAGGTLTDAATTKITGTQGSAVTKGAAAIAFNASGAAQFNGGSSSASGFDTTPSSTVLQPGAQVSIELWIRPSAVNTTGVTETLVAYGAVSPAGLAYRLQITSPYNKITFAVRTNSAAQYVQAFGTTRLAAGAIYHVVGTYNGSTAQIYINGVADGSAGGGSGSLYYYPGTAGPTGLSIGGLSGTPQFNGIIQDVAVYPSALAAATVQTHFLDGISTPTVTQNPARAATFINSVGVNTHFSFQNTEWDTSYASIKSLLLATGVKHIRDKLTQTTWTAYYTHLNDLAGSGVHSVLTAQTGVTSAQIVAVAGDVPSSVEAFEGLNEPDLDGSGWETKAIDTQHTLWAAVKNDGAIAALPVLGPSVTSPGNAQLLGSLSGYLDDGNIHDYFGQDDPGNSGFGAYQQWGYGGSIPFWLNWETIVAGSKPVMATETGYGTNTAYTSGIDAAVQAKYLMRSYFEQFNAGVKRTYDFQLMDESTAGSAFNYYGLVTTALQPKPSYYALKAVLASLGDSASNANTFATSPLSYVLGGDTANVHHTLLEKADGTYAFIFWVEGVDWNETANAEATVAPQTITFGFVTPPGGVTLTTLNAAGTAATSSPTVSAGTLTLTATDTVSILEFK